jgi:hypothetical protein
MGLISSCDGLFSCSILRGWGGLSASRSSSVTVSMIKVHDRVMTGAHFVDDEPFVFVDVPVRGGASGQRSPSHTSDLSFIAGGVL